MNTLDQYKNFPSSRYMGSKNKIIKDLNEVFKKHSFNSALDLFSGSSSVSYLLKAMGKKVISNDYMSFASNISNAIISNNKTKLNKKDLDLLTKKPKKYDKFVQSKFNGIFFSKEDINKILEEFFLLQLHLNMNYSEVYNLPIRYRHWYLKRLARHIENKNEIVNNARNKKGDTNNNLNSLNKFEDQISKKFNK